LRLSAINNERTDMDNFYEMTTIVLGCVVIAQYMGSKKHRLDMQRYMHMLDRIAKGDWSIYRTNEGYHVEDEVGDKVFSVKDRRKSRG
jgi:hypothetical protein